MNAQTQITEQVVFNPAEVVDRLGVVKAQIAAFEAEEKELVAALVAGGLTDYAGKLFDCHVGKEQTRVTPNRKALEDALGPLPAEYLTTSAPFRVVRLTAKK